MSSSSSPLLKEWLSLLEEEIISEAKPPPIEADDALLIIDMQADFLPADPTTNPHGGRFGVEEGGQVVAPIVQLTQAFVRAGATVVASRDYHPLDHESFIPCGGPYPVHCVQGSEGSKLLGPIASALAEGVQQLGNECAGRSKSSDVVICTCPVCDLCLAL